jgi:hypothetical protein
VAIGGVGGSGTRLVAELLRGLGYYMGGDLNEATDNLWFTLLFKRVELWEGAEGELSDGIEVFTAAMAEMRALTETEAAWVRGLAAADRPQHTSVWLKDRVTSLLAATRTPRHLRPWAWKEPNTHVVLDRLQAAMPDLAYIHVVRNGLDMAFSANQNQLRLWGARVLGVDEVDATPRNSLAFWCRVHQRVERIGRQMPGRFLWLNYDQLCSSPLDGLRVLLAFLDAVPDAATESALLARIHAPASIGRFRRHGAELFDPEDVAYVRSLGFETL